MKKIISALIGISVISALTISLTACHPFGESNLPTPSPLVNFTPTVKVKQLWSENVGDGIEGDSGLRFTVGYSQGLIFTTDAEGDVEATNAQTGAAVWQNYLDKNVTSGVAAGSGIVVVGTTTGHAIALATKTGKQVWDVDLGNQMLAAPQIVDNIVIVKTLAGTLVALDAKSGRQLWNFVSQAPTLILRMGSTPQVAGHSVYVGFASGRLSALTLQMGLLRWQQQVAQPQGVNDVQQMVDIDADPVLRSQRVYVATYQGRIAALAMHNGKPVWSHKLSTYTGLVADSNAVFVTDTTGHVWAFAASSGRVLWRQKKLEARLLSAPAMLGNYLVIGDAEGYLHFINKQTGQFAARMLVDEDDPIASKPIVVNNTVYVLSNQGNLEAYQVAK